MSYRCYNINTRAKPTKDRKYGFHQQYTTPPKPQNKLSTLEKLMHVPTPPAAMRTTHKKGARVLTSEECMLEAQTKADKKKQKEIDKLERIEMRKKKAEEKMKKRRKAEKERTYRHVEKAETATKGRRETATERGKREKTRRKRVTRKYKNTTTRKQM